MKKDNEEEEVEEKKEKKKYTQTEKYTVHTHLRQAQNTPA